MVSVLKQLLSEWSAEKNQRLKMQRAYFIIVIALAFVAGIVTLFSASLGRSLVMVAALIALVYLVNAVVWTILDMIVSRKLDKWLRPTAGKKR